MCNNSHGTCREQLLADRPSAQVQGIHSSGTNSRSHDTFRVESDVPVQYPLHSSVMAVKHAILKGLGSSSCHDGGRFAARSRGHAGPFARLRMDSHVEERGHVGNFVELKKTRLGAGAKSMHLAYLGDSEIGARSNIGAGTITCNYDGFVKHPTHIGEGAFIGSNSTLVAPIEIGEGAYVAAGRWSPNRCRRTRWRWGARSKR